MSVHPSGKCAFPKCDKPSVLEGYCNFHYNLISSQQTKQIMGQMVDILSRMNNRLESIEGQLQTGSSFTSQSSSSKNVTNKKEITSQFIPTLNITDCPDVEIQTTQTQSTKNIQDIAAKLNQLSEDS